MTDLAAIRTLSARLEPCHSFVYFRPEPGLAFAALGLSPTQAYFASRAAAMGPVGPEVVAATFFNFNPTLVHDAIPAAWAIADPATIVAARVAAADQALRTMLGDLVDHPDLAPVTALLRRVAEAADPAGRALFAGHAGLAWPEPVVGQFFHAVTLLREFRGDGHLAALVLDGVGPVEALVRDVASDRARLPESLLQATRGWSDEEWAAGYDRLADLGELGPDRTLNDAGRARRERIEDHTDRAGAAPWAVVDEDELAWLAEHSAPFTKTVAAQLFG